LLRSEVLEDAAGEDHEAEDERAHGAHAPTLRTEPYAGNKSAYCAPCRLRMAPVGSLLRKPHHPEVACRSSNSPLPRCCLASSRASSLPSRSSRRSTAERTR